MLAEVPAVEDLGPVTMGTDSAPVITLDGKSVVYVQTLTSPPVVVSRSIASGTETTLFGVPLGSSLWTLNYGTGSLLFTVPGVGTARHILEYSLSGNVIRDFDVPAGFQDFNASISPDGTTLAFIRRNESNGVRTLSVRAVSSGTSMVSGSVSFFSGELILAVQWLDDTRILVSAQVGSGTVVNKIQNLSTGIASNAAGLGLRATPDPSGRHIALLAGATGALDLWLSGATGESRTQLTASASTKLAMNWSADGRAIVYENRSASPVVSSLQVLSLPPLQ